MSKIGDQNFNLPTYQDVETAALRLAGVAHKTPVFTSQTVNKITEAEVFFKCENLQRTGSFKFRGAYNALCQLSDEEKQRGVITYSSGNHAQAIALAGQILGINTVIVMPDDAPSVKVAATRNYGGEIITYNRRQIAREELAGSLAKSRDLVTIPPFDHPHIIAGQGTATKELIESVGSLDLLLVCCGGGGLLSGSAIAADNLSPNCRVIGVEPSQADDATHSFYLQTLQTIDYPETIADGARTRCLGHLTFPLILKYVDDMVTVSEDAIRRAMLFINQRLKLVVEPTGALATAPLLEGIIRAPNSKIGVIISGGNLDYDD
jgi:threonine dehydratase